MLKVKIAAPPEKGKANQQLIELMGAMGMREARRLRGDVGRAMFFEELEEEQESHKERIAELERDLEVARRNTGGPRTPDGKPVPTGPVVIAPDIEGEVVEVNDEWNFVILNLGREEGVNEEMQMLVARDDELVARLQVSKVLRKISIAEILPEVQTTGIKIGDRVILPDEKPTLKTD